MIYFSSEESGLIHLRSYHVESLRRPGVLNPAHASDEVKRVPVQLAVFHMRVVHIDRDNLADYEAAAGGRGREVENLMKFAFKANWRFGDSRRPHDFRRLRSNLRQFKFIYRRIVFPAG